MAKAITHVAPDSRSLDVAQWLKDLDDNLNGIEAIIVSGGDGTLLEAIHLFWDKGLPFFGINRGTYGFLLNPIATKDEFVAALQSFKNWELVNLKMLRIKLHLRDGSMKEEFAFNDAFFKAKRGEIAGIVRGESLPDQEFCGDGIIISTPQGSTAYNKSAGGSILPLNISQMSVVSICSAAPPIRHILPDEQVEVEITRNMDQAVFRADRFDTDDCIAATISHDGPAVSLAFLPGYNFKLIRNQPRFS